MGKRLGAEGHPGLHCRGEVLVLALVLLLVADLACGQTGPTPHFYFAQITDTHLSDDGSFARTQKVLEKLGALPFDIAFVAHTGDITMDNLADQAVRDRAVALMRTCKYPVYYTPGNHDLAPEPDSASVAQYRQTFGELVYYREVQGVRCVFFFSVPVAEGTPSGSQVLDAVEQLVSQAGKPVVLFTHVPALEDFYRNSLHPGWPPDYDQRWQRILAHPEVKAVIYGHFHRDEFGWINQVPQYVSTPVVGYWGRQATFRLYEYQDGRISYRTIYVE